MPQWGKHSKLIVYHGSDDLSVSGAKSVSVGQPVSGFKISLAHCRPATDFGQGFYVTTSEHQARQWANNRVLRTLKPYGPTANAIVLRFDIDWDALAGLETLAFVRPTLDFWNLVQDCRNGFPPHPRSGSGNRAFDVVYGPVTLWPQRLVLQDCDQISFHTATGIALLTSVSLHDSAIGTSNGLFP